MSECKHIPFCYTHRYTQLLSEGRVDETTITVDHDEYLYLQKQGRTINQMAKKWGTTKEAIKQANALERQLRANEREDALQAIAEGEHRDFSEVPSLSDGVKPAQVHSGGDESNIIQDSTRTCTFIFEQKDTNSHVMHSRLIQRWAQAKGIALVQIPTGTVENIPKLASEGRFVRIIMWDRTDAPSGDLDAIRKDLDAKGIDLILLGEHRDLWQGLFSEDDANSVKPRFKTKSRWLEFCWEHKAIVNSRRIITGTRPTCFASLESVMDCARLAIPVWVVAEAIGIGTNTLLDALDAESFRELYACEFLGIADASEGIQVPKATQRTLDVVNVAQEPSVEPSQDPVPETVQQEVPKEPEHVEQSEPIQTAERPDDAPEVFVVSGEVPVKSEVPKHSGHTQGGRRIVVIDEPLITHSGAVSIVSTIRGQKGPDENVWTFATDPETGKEAYIIKSFRANIAYRDGAAMYYTGGELHIEDVSFTPNSTGIILERNGLQYEEVGRLTIELEDRSAVVVPVASDFPIRTKRWIA